VRTISPVPSDHDSSTPGLDRQPVDREGARRRFGASRVDAREVDFSDAIGGSHRSYRTRSSRRRMVKNDKGEDEVVYMSDSEDETLGRKLARLKREAEEVKLQLQKLEREKDSEAEFKDSVEQQQQQQPDQEESIDRDGVEELSRVLDGLSVKAGLKGLGTTEEDFLSKLDSNARQRQRQQTKDGVSRSIEGQTPSSNDAPPALVAVAAFSDRLTALETALGVASSSAESSQTTSIIPTLDSLSSQIATLFSALNPTTSNTTAATPHTTPFLDSVSNKLKTLTNESKTLEQSRKSALEALEKLHDTRMNQLVSATIHTNTRPRRGLSNASAGGGGGGPGGGSNLYPTNNSSNYNNAPTNNNNSQQIADLSRPDDESLQITSRVFLEEQAAKVTALYQLLPSIQNLQPLLPVVLERLRALSVIHTGAAEAKSGLDEVERRQIEMQAEIKQWREAVEVVEKGMLELEESMKGNAKVVGDMVGNLEGRIGSLGSRR
jgi:nuclear migration protein JNM1